jgi:hypothetical protein
VITFEAHGTDIRNNNGTPAPDAALPGGITAIAAQVGSTSLPGTANNNLLIVSLRDCRVEGNVGSYQINAFGARSLNAASNNPAGSNNVVSIDLHGVSRIATVNGVPSVPAEAAGTNKVNIFR